ncbi:hypothetical protein ACHAQH_009654 [Verticillium albo-atrum]
MAEKCYSQEQLAQYSSRIRLPPPLSSQDPLARLTQLVQHQLVHVPFETLALHYSTDKLISLDSAALFDKIVTRRRGGYCLENNAFFGNVLRSMGYAVYGVICRISTATRGVHDGSWRPMSHMANILSINETKYLIDVGYGADGPVHALPLSSGTVHPGLPGQQLKLDFKSLPQHRDQSQKVWVYSQRRGHDPWQEIYHFPETEVLAADFEVLNFYNMSLSLWATTVVAQRFVQGGDGQIDKTLLLVRDVVSVGDGEHKEQQHFEKLLSEDQRVDAFKRHFGIVLTDTERRAIMGRQSEIIKFQP